jgi:alanyl-tRNA synthetase
VRVVSMGEIEDAENHERTYSIELCGGTHVHRTGDIGLITIVGESAVAAGVRRIEAKTRDEARKRLEADARAYADLTALLRAPAGEAAERLEALIDDKRKLERELAEARRKLALAGESGTRDAGRLWRSDTVPEPGWQGAPASMPPVMVQGWTEVAGIRLMSRTVQGLDAKDLKPLADEAKAILGSGVVAIAAASEDGKASIVVAVTPDLTSRFNAVELVRLGSAALGGKGGGGRPDMAQAGGPDGAKTREALAAVEEGVRRAAGA